MCLKVQLVLLFKCCEITTKQHNEILTKIIDVHIIMLIDYYKYFKLTCYLSQIQNEIKISNNVVMFCITY